MEWFKKVDIETPSVTIRGETIYFNSATVAKFNLKDYNYAYMGYDKENDIIGFKFFKTKKTDAWKLSRNKTTSGKTLAISCVSFLGRNNIIVSKKFKTTIEKEKDYYITKPLGIRRK